MKSIQQIDDILRNTYKGTPQEHAPEGMELRIMEQIRLLDKPVPLYQPVITKKGWMIIVFIISAVIMALIVFADGDSEVLSFLKVSNLSLPFDFVQNPLSNVSIHWEVPEFMKNIMIIIPFSLFVLVGVERILQIRRYSREKRL